jgi:hypothetical protein
LPQLRIGFDATPALNHRDFACAVPLVRECHNPGESPRQVAPLKHCDMPRAPISGAG